MLSTRGAGRENLGRELRGRGGVVRRLRREFSPKDRVRGSSDAIFAAKEATERAHDGFLRRKLASEVFKARSFARGRRPRRASAREIAGRSWLATPALALTPVERSRAWSRRRPATTPRAHWHSTTWQCAAAVASHGRTTESTSRRSTWLPATLDVGRRTSGRLFSCEHACLSQSATFRRATADGSDIVGFRRQWYPPSRSPH